MSSIAENVKRIRERIAEAAAQSGREAEAIRLVAVSKTVDPERIRAALAAGVREIGENYLQEAVPKFHELRDQSFLRHYIGHLQRNKAGRAAETFDIIQSIDSEILARAVGRRAVAVGRSLEVLIEVNISGEGSKSGVLPDETLSLAETVGEVQGLRLAGLMGIGPMNREIPETASAFRSLAQIYSKLPRPCRQILSMGMSADYELAIREGSTMVRIGTAIFGSRRKHA